MEKFTEFLVNNYIWFLVGVLVLVFALIGYIADNKQKKKIASGEIQPKPKKEKKRKKSEEETKTEEIKAEMKDMENVSLGEVFSKKEEKTKEPKEDLPMTKEEAALEKTEILFDEPLIKEETPDENAFEVEDK